MNGEPLDLASTETTNKDLKESKYEFSSRCSSLLLDISYLENNKYGSATDFRYSLQLIKVIRNYT